jgi:anaerobic selenocysteine-containing dehydrogenase
MYMANMSWNSAMNVPDTIAALTAKRGDGEYVIPRIIYSDAYASEMVHYADLILPDTTYLERWDAISLLDRPISDADGPADSIRQPVVEPDRDVRPFQDVLLDLGARLGLPAHGHAGWQPPLSRRLFRLSGQPRTCARPRAARRLPWSGRPHVGQGAGEPQAA